jgi:hypothetical protein
MNGVFGSQTSSNRWVSSFPVMLHEGIQGPLANWPTRRNGGSFIKELERQMVEQAEFAEAIKDLKKRFIFNDTAAIESFLQTHRALVPLLLESVPYLRKSFGQETPLALEIMADDGPPRAIYALALWRGDRINSRAALRDFDEAWWLNNLENAGGAIVFDYELV